MKELIEDYERRLKKVADAIKIKKEKKKSTYRLSVRASCYRDFLTELKNLALPDVIERYTKDNILNYGGLWHVCFKDRTNRYIKVSDGFKTKTEAETERKLLNAL